MQTEDYAVLSASVFGVAVYVALFGLFVGLKKYRSRHIQLDGQGVQNAVYSEGDTPVYQLIRQTWTTDLKQVSALCGLESFIYLSLHLRIVYMIAILSVACVASLVPLYTLGNPSDPSVFERMGINNILTD